MSSAQLHVDPVNMEDVVALEVSDPNEKPLIQEQHKAEIDSQWETFLDGDYKICVTAALPHD